MNKNSNNKNRSPTKKKKYKGKFYSTQEYRTYWFARGYYARTLSGNDSLNIVNLKINNNLDNRKSFNKGRDDEMEEIYINKYKNHPILKKDKK